VVALSSCEAEYISATTGACQVVWIARLLSELKDSEISVPVLRIDNKSTISLVKNPVHHDRSKHIDVRFHLGSMKILGRLLLNSSEQRSSWLMF
jgi:hypothetical protein